MPPIIRRATPGDARWVEPLSAALMAHEQLTPPEGQLRAAIDRLLADPELGFVLVLEIGGALRGHAVCTFGYDLEFAGRDAWLTELFVDERFRGQRHGAALLAEVEHVAKQHDVRALHLQVRDDNHARRLYDRAGYAAVPRLVMSKRL